MSEKFIVVGADGQNEEKLGYSTTEFITTSAGAGDAGKPIALDSAGQIDATMINDGDISHLNISDIGTNTHAQIDSHIADLTKHFLMIDDDSMGSASSTTAASSESIVAYVQSQIVSDMTYKGVIDVATPSPDLDAIDNDKGDWYKVQVAGTYLGETWAVGDNLIVNKDVASGTTITSADVDKVDNTESPDILREGDLSDGEMFVGNASNIATAVTMSGDVAISNAGVSAISSNVIVNDDVNASAGIEFSKMETGASANILVANGSGVPALVAMSGDATISNSGAVTIADDAIQDNMVDWGTGANQVSAVDVPLADAGGFFSTDDVESALQQLAGEVQNSGVTYTAGVGGVTKGHLMYISSNNTVLPYSTLTDSHRGIGLAFSTESAASDVIVSANDTVVTSVLTGATAGTPYYWTGSAISSTIPSGSGSHVWQIGVAKNATDLAVECRHVKKNA